MRLETDRLILQPVGDFFFPTFMEMDIDPEVMKFIRKPSADESEARMRFNKLQNYMKNFPGFGGFAISRKDSGEMLGIGFLIHIEMSPEYGYEVGYRFKRSAWGNGFATEVSKKLIQYGFEDKKLAEIFATTNPEHVVSQKTLMKAGFVKIGSATYHGGCTLFKISQSDQAVRDHG